MKKTDLNGSIDNAPEEEKKKRIEEELKRISVLYANMDKNKKAVISPILQNASFMRVTLEDLQKLILEEGVVDTYMNGANQHGRKQSASLQAYNNLIKVYASVTKTLTQMLPPEKKIQLPGWIMGKSLVAWEQIKHEEEEENPTICFISFEEWLMQKAQEYEADSEELGADWINNAKRELSEKDTPDNELESFEEWLKRTNEENDNAEI